MLTVGHCSDVARCNTSCTLDKQLKILAQAAHNIRWEDWQLGTRQGRKFGHWKLVNRSR